MAFLVYHHSCLRWALRYMTAPEFKIYTYLITIPIRPKRDMPSRFRNGMAIYDLYHKGRLLVSNVSVGRIAEECKIGERTVAKAIRRFNDLGAILKVTNYKGRYSNMYLVGIENLWPNDNGFKADYFFAEFSFIQNGEIVPDAVRYFILENRYDAEKLALEKVPGIDKTLGDLFVSSYAQQKHEDEIRLFKVKG